MKNADSDSARHTDRRRFLKGASIGGLAAVVAPVTPIDAQAPVARQSEASSVPAAPSKLLEIEHAEHDAGTEAGDKAPFASDLMIDVLRGLGIETIAAVPGSTFAGLQESAINYGLVTEPAMQWFTTTHEETSVAFCHGYAKVAGKPIACMVHSVVGLQHAAMALYNAYVDRAPVITLTGSLTNPDAREGFVDWIHAVSDGPALVRDFVKFDETPRTLDHFVQSAVRAYRFAMTPPCGPVVLAVDMDLQRQTVPPGTMKPPSRAPIVAAPQGDANAVRESARLLANAENPVIVADRAVRTPEGLRQIVRLAEALNAGVVDMQGRMNFPWRHPLNQTSRRQTALRQADVVLGLELIDYAGFVKPAAHARKISISATDYFVKSNYQAFGSEPVLDLAIAGDAEATLPALIEAVKQQMGLKSRSTIDARGKRLSDAHAAALAASREAAAIGWDVRPITTARLHAEIYDQVRDKDWALMSGDHFQSYWAQQLWDARHCHQFIGDSGGYGLGYLSGAAIGAAYAHKPHGRIAIAIGGDGDFLMAPGAMWTAAQNQIPLLYVIHNNGGYHQEIMKVRAQALRRDRATQRGRIGSDLPGVDYAMMARSMGVSGERVSEPGELRGAIARALAEVAAGRPALLDVVSQGR